MKIETNLSSPAPLNPAIKKAPPRDPGPGREANGRNGFLILFLWISASILLAVRVLPLLFLEESTPWYGYLWRALPGAFMLYFALAMHYISSRSLKAFASGEYISGRVAKLQTHLFLITIAEVEFRTPEGRDVKAAVFGARGTGPLDIKEGDEATVLFTTTSNSVCVYAPTTLLLGTRVVPR